MYKRNILSQPRCAGRRRTKRRGGRAAFPAILGSPGDVKSLASMVRPGLLWMTELDFASAMSSRVNFS